MIISFVFVFSKDGLFRFRLCKSGKSFFEVRWSVDYFSNFKILAIPKAFLPNITMEDKWTGKIIKRQNIMSNLISIYRS